LKVGKAVPGWLKGEKMKIRTIGTVMAVVLTLGGSAWAETKADKLGLGDHAADPEKIGKIGNDLSVRVRLIREKNGELAGLVPKGETVSVQVDYIGREGAKDRPVALVCYGQFIDTEAETSKMIVNGKPCFEGRLEDSYGRFTRLGMDMRFRPEVSDPNGTYGIVIKVEDSVSGKSITLVPTYSWQDGKG
jgi:hypothetical protein